MPGKNENEYQLYPEGTAFAEDLNKEYNTKLQEFKLNPDIESLIDLLLLEKDPYRARLLYYLYGDPYWKPVLKGNLRIDDKGQVWDYKFKDNPKLLREVRSDYSLPGVTVTARSSYMPSERRLARKLFDNVLNYEQRPKYLEGSSGTPMTISDLMEGVNTFSAGALNWIYPMFHFPGLIRKGIEHPEEVSAYDVFLGHYPIMGEKFELQHPFLNLGAEMAIGGGLEGLARNSSKLLPGVEKVVKSIGSHIPTTKVLLNTPIKPIIHPNIQWTPQIQETFDEMIKRMSLSTKVSLDILKEIADNYGIQLDKNFLKSSPSDLIKRYNIHIVPENTDVYGDILTKSKYGETIGTTIEESILDPEIYLNGYWLQSPKVMYTTGVHEGNHALWLLPEILLFFREAVKRVPPDKLNYNPDSYLKRFGYQYPEAKSKSLLENSYPIDILSHINLSSDDMLERSAVNTELRTLLLTESPKIDLNNPSTWKKWRKIIKNLKREDILKFDDSRWDNKLGGVYIKMPRSKYMHDYTTAINNHAQSAGKEVVNLYADNMKQAFQYVPGIAALIGGIGVTLHKRGGTVKWHGKKFKWCPIPKGEQGLTFGMESLFGNDLGNNNTKPVNNHSRTTDEQLVDAYINKIVYLMENPKNKGLNNGLYGWYTDKDLDGNIHWNIGPGIESHSDIAKSLNRNKSYSKELLNALLRQDLLGKMKNIRALLTNLGLGNFTDDIGLIFLDIAHNVKPGEGIKKLNMPESWPALIEAIKNKNRAKMYEETRSGNDRRRDMRNLIWGKNIYDVIIKNV